MKNEVIQGLDANNPALAMAKAKILLEQNCSNYENHLFCQHSLAALKRIKGYIVLTIMEYFIKVNRT